MMASRLYNPAIGHLLFVLTVTSWLIANGSVLTESARDSRVDDTTIPETTSLQGTLQGVNMVTRNNRTYYGFIGIPYAEPPVGDLRFKAPVAAGAWNGTFNASSNSNECPQISSGAVIGDEDCLFLNVFTPKLRTDDNSTLLPVMFFIFGGGFKTGSVHTSRYDPSYLLEKDIVLVLPNYRLGVLGYLTTGDEASPGNYGLKDMVLALQWVQDNIQYFGGDPNQVTLFGGSSGAMSVSLLTLSELTKGLFHRYITQSGTAFNIELWQPREAFVNRTTLLAEYLGCPVNTSSLLVECLRGLNASLLIDTSQTLFYVWDTIPDCNWFPTVEPDVEGALLTDSPANLVANGKNHDLPAISLVTRDEGFSHSLPLYADLDVFEEFLDNIDQLLPYRLGYWNSVDNVTAFTAALKSYYLKDLTANRSLVLTNLTELMGDAVFIYPAYRMLQEQLVHATSPLYFCSFQYKGIFSNTYEWIGSTDWGVAHGDEIIYLFKNHNSRHAPDDYEFSEVDWSMVDTMVQLWTSFAINGTPTVADPNSSTIWTPYSSLNNYLRIGNETDTALEMQHDLFIERMQFWDQLMASISDELTTSTSGDLRNQVELLQIVLCLFVLSALHGT